MKIEVQSKKEDNEELKDHTEEFYLDPIIGKRYQRVGIQMRHSS